MKRTKKPPERRDEDGRILFDGPDEIPDFASEAEEAAWWNTHAPSDAYLATGVAIDLHKALALADRAARDAPDGEPLRWPPGTPEPWKRRH